MIKTLIFDFGNVFINLDKEGAIANALELFEIEEFPEELIAMNALYEQGLLSTEEFIEFYSFNFPELSKNDIIDAWNHILCDFPVRRLEFLQQLAKDKKYQLILLSNTNALHIECIEKHISFYEAFKACFDKFYLSHEIMMRKPDATIFNFVLSENNLKPEECLFIDDTLENTEAASTLGMNVWNNNPENEDIIDIFTLKRDFF